MNNRYTWDDVSTHFLAKLNRDATDDPGKVGFANHTDWRLPNIVELQTILDLLCAGDPCIIDPKLGKTASASYWSSTSSKGVPTKAWFVDFDNPPEVDNANKDNFFHVRAVRGGR